MSDGVALESIIRKALIPQNFLSGVELGCRSDSGQTYMLEVGGAQVFTKAHRQRLCGRIHGYHCVALRRSLRQVDCLSIERSGHPKQNAAQVAIFDDVWVI